jgi:hypothetical protein
MGLKFDSVMSREFSGMRPRPWIRLGNCKFPVSTTAPRRSDFQKRSQFFVRADNEPLTVAFVNYSSTVSMGAMQFWLQKSIRLPRPYLRFLAGKVSRRPTH